MLAKSKLNSVKVLISKALIDLNISHDEFVLINNVLKLFYDMEEKIKYTENSKSKTMLSYCVRCRKNTESKNPKVVRTKNGRVMLLSKCSVSNCKKLRFSKEQEVRKVLSNLTLVKIMLLSNLPILNAFLKKYKINQIINKFLKGDKFIEDNQDLRIVPAVYSLKIKKK